MNVLAWVSFFIFFQSLAIAGQMPVLSETSWPKMDNFQKDPFLESVFLIAKEAFASKKFSLADPSVFIPKNLENNVLFQEGGLNAFKEREPIKKNTIFEKLETEDFSKEIYWQTEALGDHRLILSKTRIGCQGWDYDLTLIPRSVSKKDFEDKQFQGIHETITLIQNSWTPPLILKGTEDQTLLVIIGPHPVDVLGDWTVYSVGPKDHEKCSVIHFKPRDSELKIPEALKRLTKLLKKVLGGKPEEEGTLRRTLCLHQEAWCVVQNMIVRPWVVGPDPYNSREQVECGLQQWSRASALKKKIYTQIQNEYKKTEKSLTDYFQKHFGMNQEDATKRSQYWVDILLRSFFVFSR